ncbi:unnamed protein product [Urochloa decumbens]|uniref:Protein FAR1-RELATED SEQUENCE n=1 Tax=Urochloa decumbens TaxID=240449 RepID=A0ABC9APP2_9POAL
MTSTQRSESANHMLKTYIPRAAPMHLFVSQYARLIADRSADEGREDHATNQVSQPLRFGVPIEAHAATVYTRAMMDRFHRELFRSGAFSCLSQGGGSFRVERISINDAMASWRNEYTVHVAGEGKSYLCDWANEIPASLILKRWTAQAKGSATLGSSRADSRAAPDLAALHSILYNAAMELVSMGGASRQAFEVALSHVARGKTAIAAMTVIPADSAPEEPEQASEVISGSEDVIDSQLANLSAPPRVRSRGRPAQNRLKAPIESPGARKRKAPSATSNRIGVTTRSRIRPVQPAGHVVDKTSSGQRKCQLCGEQGHYRSTCGRKSSYTPK